MKWKILFIAWFFSGATSARTSLLGRLWFLQYQEIDDISTDLDDSRCPKDILKMHPRRVKSKWKWKSKWKLQVGLGLGCPIKPHIYRLNRLAVNGAFY